MNLITRVFLVVILFVLGGGLITVGKVLLAERGLLMPGLVKIPIVFATLAGCKAIWNYKRPQKPDSPSGVSKTN